MDGTRRQDESHDFYHGNEGLRALGRDARAKEVALAMIDSCTRGGDKIVRQGGSPDLKFTLMNMSFSDTPVRGADEFRILQQLAEFKPSEVQRLARGEEVPGTEEIVGDKEFLASVLLTFNTLLRVADDDTQTREGLERSIGAARARIDEALGLGKAGDGAPSDETAHPAEA